MSPNTLHFPALPDLLELPLNNNMLSQLQQKDMFCNNILTQIDKGNIKEGQLYTIKDKLFKEVCCRWQ